MNHKILKMDPIFDEQDELIKVEAWIDSVRTSKKIYFIYRPDLDSSLAFANASSEYTRAKVVNCNGSETMMLSLKQGSEVILPRGKDFKLDAFVWKDENGNEKEMKYKILIIDEDA